MKSKLRHPIRAIREPFGKAGLTVAVIALVMALVGGAYAAGGLTRPQEKQVIKIAKKYAGKPGAVGPAGAPGPAGPIGPAGPAGKNGTNGKEGPEGPEGSPWSAGGTLPSKATETGVWSFGPIAESSVPQVGFFHAVKVPISFTLPLAAQLKNPAPECDQPSHPACVVHYIAAGGTTPSGCIGSVVSPGAAPGNLCVFAAQEHEAISTAEFIRSAESGSQGAENEGVSGKTGAILEVLILGSAGYGKGTWAVTAP